MFPNTAIGVNDFEIGGLEIEERDLLSLSPKRDKTRYNPRAIDYDRKRGRERQGNEYEGSQLNVSHQTQTFLSVAYQRVFLLMCVSVLFSILFIPSLLICIQTRQLS